jgi:hypothetical protein
MGIPFESAEIPVIWRVTCAEGRAISERRTGIGQLDKTDDDLARASPLHRFHECSAQLEFGI